MSKRKTALRVTNAEERAAEEKTQRRVDIAEERRSRAAHSRTLLPSLAEWREARDRMSADELLTVCRQASRLEMRGASYSAEDRADCAAELTRRLLLETGGAMPRRDSQRVTLTRFCGEARNLRDSLDRQRARDAADTKRAAEDYAVTPAALGIDSTPAKHAAILARSSESHACAAVGAVLDALGVSDDVDGPVWLTLYGWVTGRTSDDVAEHRAMSRSLIAKRQAAGAKFLRGYFSLAELAARLTLGARVTSGLPRNRIAPGTVLLALEDRSREAHGRTPAMAQDWREGTADGSRPERPADAATARAECECFAMAKAEKVHWRKRRASRKDHDTETAAALARLARQHAIASRGRPPTSPRTSDLSRAQVNAA